MNLSETAGGNVARFQTAVCVQAAPSLVNRNCQHKAEILGKPFCNANQDCESPWKIISILVAARG